MKNKLIIIAAIVVALVGTVVFWQHKLKNGPAGSKNGTAQDQQFPAINGVPVPENIAKTRPVAVVIENHTDARPQSGLYQADIVYETLAEGGITRLLALFQTQNPKEIGPVRSARPYFNFEANQWGAAFAHVGGSDIALTQLDTGVYKNLQDINQFFYGDYFYRSKDRLAPHNAYTNLDLLRALIEKKKWQDWTPTKLGDFETIPTEQLQTAVTKISIKFFDPAYAAAFTFDPSTGLYARTNAGKPSIDKNNNTQIYPRNVVIQYVDDYVVPMEKANGVGLKLDEDGRAVLFTGGKAVDGTWKYNGDHTEYLNSDGQPQKFQPGQTWIVLMPKSISANATWQ
ncbi:MAG TPA: DUF3048 domain-containing protein [Patescibacteria group bacterium]|jgi:hypothetical protein|nr:DUF3048 domain-containing protein [Patescibacteria group bacterium]